MARGFMKRLSSVFAIAVLALGTSFAFVDDVDARRGGGFGSRGARTFQAPPATQTAPTTAQPIQRSMTQPNAAQPGQATAPSAAAQAQRPGFLGGFGGSMLRGLAIGGLIGLLLGHGFGGLAGAFGFILQIALIALGVMLLMRFLASRRQPSAAGGPPLGQASFRDALGGGASPSRPVQSGLGGLGFGAASKPRRPANARNDQDEVGITDRDLEDFQRLLGEIQSAFGREDYAALRERTTPEIMSYLSEELASNATGGVRNDVSDVTLLQGDLAEAWREDNSDYATVAMRYESRDVMRDRTTGEPVAGQPDALSETTEVWTFVRRDGGEWKLSAIQDA